MRTLRVGWVARSRGAATRDSATRLKWATRRISESATLASPRLWSASRTGAAGSLAVTLQLCVFVFIRCTAQASILSTLASQDWRKSLPPFCYLSKQIQAFQWLQGQCRLQPVFNLRVDMPVSRPISLTRGRRNILRENAFPPLPALGARASRTWGIPCLILPFFSLGPHCSFSRWRIPAFALLAQLQSSCYLADAALPASCTLSHILKRSLNAWLCLWVTLQKNSFSSEKKFYNFGSLKRISLGEFHAFVYHVSKSWRVCNVERNAVSNKERCYYSIPFFGSWLLQYHCIFFLYHFTLFSHLLNPKP